MLSKASNCISSSTCFVRSETDENYQIFHLLKRIIITVIWPYIFSCNGCIHPDGGGGGGGGGGQWFP